MACGAAMSGSKAAVALRDAKLRTKISATQYVGRPGPANIKPTCLQRFLVFLVEKLPLPLRLLVAVLPASFWVDRVSAMLMRGLNLTVLRH